MRILIAGDLVPTAKNEQIFKNGLIDNLSDSFKKVWFNSEFRIFNLECPITEPVNSIEKNGPSLSCAPSCIKGINDLNPSLLLLSNNHILDYGIDGLNSTIDILNTNDIPFTGIIKNNKVSNDGYILEKDNIKVGIYNVCDKEFSCATNDTIGTSYLSIKNNYLEINKLKKKCDYLIIIYHGGKEYYQYPTPELKELCEYFVELGGDIVICQHSHCIGCEEKYKDGTIIYGQGNFIFDSDDSNILEKNSLIVDIEFTKEKYNLKYIPIEKSNNLVDLSKNNNIIKEFDKRTQMAKDYKKIEKEFNNFSFPILNSYLSIFSKTTLLKRIINKFFIKNYYLKKYTKKDLIKILNVIECEAHREVLINALKLNIKRKNNR